MTETELMILRGRFAATIFGGLAAAGHAVLKADFRSDVIRDCIGVADEIIRQVGLADVSTKRKAP